MNKLTLPIKGMHCKACAMLIEERIKEFPKIKRVEVNYKKKEANIYSESTVNVNKIISAIKETGYEVGKDEKKLWFSRNWRDYRDIGVSLLIVAAIYFILKLFGFNGLNFNYQMNPSNLFVVLTIGLAAGFSSCMALVGGLVLGVSSRFSEKHPDANTAQKFKPHLLFNMGRIVTFFLLGGAIGTIGKAFQFSAPVLGSLIIIVGTVMLVLGIQLTEVFPRFSEVTVSLPSSLGRLLKLKNREKREYNNLNSMVMGGLTFFLPCGFTQAMQLFAVSSGSFWSGALIMSIFALGTTPGLIGIGGITALVKGPFSKKFFKFTGILVILFAAFNISNGLNLAGIKNPFLFKNNAVIASPGPGGSQQVPANDPNVKLENGVQVVNMTQEADGYNPNEFIIQKGIPVRWVIDSVSQNSCAVSFMVPKLGISGVLNPGENVIEFTPKETGEIGFSCSMGMYTGRLIVVDNIDYSSSTTSDNTIDHVTTDTSSVSQQSNTDSQKKG